MFSTLEAIWAGLTGKLKDQPRAQKVFWVLLIAFLAGWGGTVFAAWISYPSYYNLIDFIDHADLGAYVFTVLIAVFLYFALAYVGGYMVEKMLSIPEQRRDYMALGFRILLITGLLFLYIDFNMNMRGAEVRSETAAGEIVTYTYESPSTVVDRLRSDRQKLQDIEGGKVGGYGWRDPRTGIFHLNQSGKTAARSVRESIRRTEQTDSTAQAAFIADQTALNNTRNYNQQRIQQTLRGAVYGVYGFIFLLCIVQAYCVEMIQLALEEQGKPSPTPQPQPKRKRSMKERLSTFWHGEEVQPVTAESQTQIGFKQSSSPSNSVGPIGFQSSAPSPSPTVQNDTDGNRKGGFHRHTVHTRTVSQKGYRIKCANCGTVATMKSPRAKYCSDACRKSAHNASNPNNQVRA